MINKIIYSSIYHEVSQNMRLLMFFVSCPAAPLFISLSMANIFSLVKSEKL